MTFARRSRLVVEPLSPCPPEIIHLIREKTLQPQPVPVAAPCGAEEERRPDHHGEADKDPLALSQPERNTLKSPTSGEEAAYLRPDLARDLLRRRDEAAARWKSRATAPSEVEHAVGREANRANAAVLRRIMADHGWPDRSMVGPEASRAAYHLALHAEDVDLHKEVLACMADSVSRGEVPPAHWAHLYDRCCVLAGVPQWFGTQHRHTPAGVEPYPIAEADTLDSRRAAYGLEPYASKAELVRRRCAGEAA